MKKFLLIFVFAFSSYASSNVIEKAIPTTVFVMNKSNPFDQSYDYNPNSYWEYVRPFYEWVWPPTYSHGTGFLISPDGYIVTNEHVVEGATEIQVALQGYEERIVKAKLIGADPRTDIAVLKIDPPVGKTFPYLNLANSDNVAVGNPIYLIGNPLHDGLESTVTTGIISGKKRVVGDHQITGYFQTDAAINGGNSGGPAINENGEVIGVVALHYWLFYEGLGFLIPSKTVKHITDQLIATGEVTQSYLGVALEDTSQTIFKWYDFDENRGAYVAEILENSPAEEAGLLEDDLIIAVDDVTISNPIDLANLIWILKPGTQIKLTIDRQEEILNLSAELKKDSIPKSLKNVVI